MNNKTKKFTKKLTNFLNHQKCLSLVSKKVDKNSWIFFYKKSSTISLLKFTNKFLVVFLTLNKIDNLYLLIFYLNSLLNLNLNVHELELKGINFRFAKFLNLILLDLGFSHFQVMSFPKNNFFLFLRTKKFKKIIFLNFLKNRYFSILNFFRFYLKPVGPYKLKGFHFFDERVRLKEGKKPFK